MSYENSFSDFKCINFAGYTQKSPMLSEGSISTAEEHFLKSPHVPFRKVGRPNTAGNMDGRLLWKNIMC